MAFSHGWIPLKIFRQRRKRNRGPRALPVGSMQITMELTQILLVIVVVALTTILSLVGVQVFLILKEVRRSVARVNKILDDAGVISESVAKPAASLSGFLTGLRSGADLVKILFKEKREKEKGEKENG